MTINQDTNSTGNHPLAGLVEALKQVVASSEDDFMSLGMNLQKVQMMSSGQRKKIAAVMGLFQADGETGLMQQISSYVAQSQKDTESAQQTANALCRGLSDMLKVMVLVDKNSRALEKAGLFLHVIGINTGIECSRYAQVESTFKVVAQETISLAEQIRKATNLLLDKSQLAQNEQHKTLQGAKKTIASLEELASDSRQATETALSKVAELVDYSISTVNDAEQMAQNITSEINRVVMGIQFHDNLRQRIEHVNDALLESAVVQQGIDSELACNTFLSVELQKVQLESLVSELDQLYSIQSQALGNIIQSVSGLEERLASMADGQSSQKTEENPVAVLLNGIDSLEQLNRQSMILSTEISSSSKRAEQVVAEMQKAIKTTFAIANSVKINALNAIIKAAKFGRAGMSLQVLAQGMVDVSRDTRQLIGDFNQLLGDLNSLARQKEADEQVATDLPASAFDSSQLQQIFQDFRSELQGSQSDCRLLAEGLTTQQQDLIFISRLKEAIAGYTAQLDHYVAAIRPQDEELLAKMRVSFGEQLESRYTMNEERAIHRQQRQLEKSAAAVVADDLLFDQPVAADSAGDDVDLWGDTPDDSSAAIELFDDAPASEPVGAVDEDIELWGDTGGDDGVELFTEEPASAQETSEAETDIELWDEPEKKAEQETGASQAAKEEEDLGDNVELF